MIQALKRIFSIEEVKTKILFTLLMLLICRIGAYIPVPGINGDAVVQVFRQLTGDHRISSNLSISFQEEPLLR